VTMDAPTVALASSGSDVAEPGLSASTQQYHQSGMFTSQSALPARIRLGILFLGFGLSVTLLSSDKQLVLLFSVLWALSVLLIIFSPHRLQDENDLIAELSRLASNPAGDLHQHVKNLTMSLDADFGFIFISDASVDPDLLLSICVYSRAENNFPDNFTATCKGTPCQYVLNQPQGVEGVVIYPKDVIKYFPDDHYLSLFNAQAYAGVPLKFPGGSENIGLLGILSVKPVSPQKCERIKTILRITAIPIAIALERKQVQTGLQEKDVTLSLLAKQIYQLKHESWDAHQKLSHLTIKNYAINEQIEKEKVERKKKKN